MSDPIMTGAVVAAIFFIAAFVRSIFGFGDALIAMPLLGLTIGIGMAVPLVGLITLTIAVIMLLRERDAIDLRAGWRLIIATVLGVPLGLLLIRMAPEALIKIPLGLLLIGYGLYNLRRPALPRISDSNNSGWVWGLGLIAGVLGGAYNTNGPPIVIYGTLRGWPPKQFRATLQFYFLITGIIIAAGQGLAGLWTADVLRLCVITLPSVILANLCGHWLGRRIRPDAYVKLVFGLLVLVGVLFLV